MRSRSHSKAAGRGRLSFIALSHFSLLKTLDLANQKEHM